MTKEASAHASVLIAMLMAAGCERPTEPPAAKTPAPPPVSAPTLPVPTPKALNRAELIAALDRAASDHAAGAASNLGIAGRSVVLRLPFGCGGPEPADAAPADGLARWTWTPDRSAIRLSVTSADWTRSPLVLSPGAEPAWDRVDGFWIARPWLSAEACPAIAPTAEATAEPGERPGAAPMTAGVAVILSTEGSRLGRRDARGGYSFLIRGADNKPPETSLQGYRLVLEGRVGAFADGQPVRCTAGGPDVRPVCVAAVQLDVVAFEDAKGGRLSEWRPQG